MLNPSFPNTRHRRTRSFAWARDIVADIFLEPSNFILPIFVRDESVPACTENGCNILRYTVDELPAILNQAAKLGIKGIMLFPVIPTEDKDETGSQALAKDSLITRALRVARSQQCPLGIFVDVALDPYTSHGHDGILLAGPDGLYLDNTLTVTALTEMSLILADAGADVLSPSDMMDGRVGSIRSALDQSGFEATLIASYAAKYASCFYGPFRTILGSHGLGGLSDKKTYQMDPRNAREALSEIAFDINEGADMLIIKPGMPYLDIITRAVDVSPIPILAYQVSGEYAMIKAAAERGFLNEKAALLESAIAFKRAGAKCIITYAALELAQWVKES